MQFGYLVYGSESYSVIDNTQILNSSNKDVATALCYQALFVDQSNMEEYV